MLRWASNQEVSPVKRVGYSMPAHLGAGLGVDDGDDLVGVGAVAVGRTCCMALEDDRRGSAGRRWDGRARARTWTWTGPSEEKIGAVGDGEVGAGGEGEVADVFAVEAEGLGAVGVAGFAGGDAGGSDHVAAREGEVDGEGAEVGEELGGGVVLVAVPGAVPEDAGFGIPLAAHDEVALVAVAGDGEGNWSWKARWKVTESLGASGRGRVISATVWSSAVAVVGRDEVEGGGEVARRCRRRCGRW